MVIHPVVAEINGGPVTVSGIAGLDPSADRSEAELKQFNIYLNWWLTGK